MSIQGKLKNTHSIEYIIDYKEPIELSVFTKALNSFSSEYKKFTSENFEGQQPTDAKLYIQDIKEGSIIATLVEFANNSIPFLANANTVVEFGGFLRNTFEYFKGNKAVQKPKYDVADLENLVGILAPACENDNSTKISVSGDNNQVLILQVGSGEANEITNRISTAKKELLEKNEKTHRKQAFYWEQAKKDIGSKTGYIGVIEAISQNKINVTFDDENIKKQMIVGQENPFTTIYIVDVEVQTVRQEPKVYKILTLHEIIQDDSEK